MAFTKVQTGVSANAVAGTTITASLASNPTAGNLCIAGLLFFDATTTPPTYTVQDANGKTYTNEAHTSGATNMNTAGFIAMTYLVVPSGASKDVTVTFNKATQAGVIWLDEFSPSTGTVTYDSGAFTSGTGAINGPSIPVNNANSLIYNVASDAFSVGAVGGSWTQVQGGNVFGNAAAYQLDVSAATSAAWAGNLAYAWNCVGMSFYMASAGGQPFIGSFSKQGSLFLPNALTAGRR